MEQEQQDAAQERVRVLAEATGLSIDEDRIPALAEALDGARLMIAQLQDLASSVDVPEGAPFDPAWREEGWRR